MKIKSVAKEIEPYFWFSINIPSFHCSFHHIYVSLDFQSFCSSFAVGQRVIFRVSEF